MMTASEFVKRLKAIATDHDTVYAWGMFGSRITAKTVEAKAKQYPGWYTEDRINRMLRLDSAWGFDCVGLVKAVLWGWSPDNGAKYAANGVLDLSADGMIGRCSDVSADFRTLEVGEFLWMKGHCGVYIGNGLAVESTPKWSGGVQITALGRKTGYNTRTWTKHGKLPYVAYGAEVTDSVKVELLVLKQGSEGEQVKVLQRLLMCLGYDLSRCGADGEFGTKTDAAVKAFQKAKGLAVDGIVGQNTWKKLLGAK
jgi:hypothetical protein